MKLSNKTAAKLAQLPLYVHFTYFLVFFGGSEFIINYWLNPSQHETALKTFLSSLLSGLLFALFMTLFVRRQRKRFITLTKTQDTYSQQVILKQALKTGILPNDTHTLTVLPAYLDNLIATNKRTRIYGTILFGLFAAGSAFYVISEHSKLFLVCGLVFVGFMILEITAPTILIRKARALRVQL